MNTRTGLAPRTLPVHLMLSPKTRGGRVGVTVLRIMADDLDDEWWLDQSTADDTKQDRRLNLFFVV